MIDKILHTETCGAFRMTPVTILSLPDELIIFICNSIKTRNDLCSLLRVCHRLNRMVEPLLYESVLLRDTQDNISFDWSISSNPDRALELRSLALHLAAVEDFEPVSVVPWLVLTSNLQELSIDSPNEENDAFDRVFYKSLPSSPTPILTCLRKCTLTFWDEYGDLWNLANKSMIFLHPTLQCLTVINAQADQWAMNDLIDYRRSTSLQELHLLKSDIHSRSLAIILAVPKALKSLRIAQSISSYPPREHSPLNLNDFILSMAPQYESLENLVIIRESDYHYVDLILEKLTKLRYLEIDPARLFRYIHTHERIVGAAFALPHILPPNLEELVWVDMKESDFLSNIILLRMVLEKKTNGEMLPALRKVTLRLLENLRPSQLFFDAADVAKVEVLVVKDGTKRKNVADSRRRDRV